MKKYLIAGLSIIFIAGGCSRIPDYRLPDPLRPSGTNKSTGQTQQGEPYVVELVDTATITGQVLSVDQHPAVYYNNTVVIKIDSVSNYARNKQAGFAPLNLPLGSEQSFSFGYSTKPAKIRCSVLPSQPSDPSAGETPVVPPGSAVPQSQPGSGTASSEPPVENGYYIFQVYSGTCSAEVVLPGVKAGDRLKFNLKYAGDIRLLNVLEYEVIK